MTPEDQLIALMQWMGWKDIRAQVYWEGKLEDNPGGRFHGAVPRLPGTGNIPDSEWLRAECPPLTLDLMHEAERKLELPDKDAEQVQLNLYATILGRMSRAAGNHYTFQATKEQRLEALVKTVGLWKEYPVADPLHGL